ALFRSFWEPRFPWFQGASFWDVSVSPTRNTGVGDTGFSPIGKPQTIQVLQQIYSFEYKKRDSKRVPFFLLLIFFKPSKPKFIRLCFRRSRRSLCHHICGRSSFWESNHITNRVCFC